MGVFNTLIFDNLKVNFNKYSLSKLINYTISSNQGKC